MPGSPATIDYLLKNVSFGDRSRDLGKYPSANGRSPVTEEARHRADEQCDEEPCDVREEAHQAGISGRAQQGESEYASLHSHSFSSLKLRVYSESGSTTESFSCLCTISPRCLLSLSLSLSLTHHSYLQDSLVNPAAVVAETLSRAGLKQRGKKVCGLAMFSDHKLVMVSDCAHFRCI